MNPPRIVPFLILLLGAAAAPSLQAQEPRLNPALDTSTVTERILPGPVISTMPADSAGALQYLLPGITMEQRGVSVRGSEPGAAARRVNGFDVTTGSRRPGVVLPIQLVREIRVRSGPEDATGGATGSARIDTRVSGDAPGTARARFATDRFSGDRSLGINRLEGTLTRRLRGGSMFLAGAVTGHSSIDLGMGARDIPGFRTAGIDTTVSFFDPDIGGTRTQSVPAFAVSRGDCDALKGLSPSLLADNYGTECTGDRTPGTGGTSLQFAAGTEFPMGQSSRVSLLTLRSRESQRLPRMQDALIPSNTFAEEHRSRLYGVRFESPFGRGKGSGILSVALSRQSNETNVGPLTPDSELDSRDPALGIMFSGLDFRWDLESFPVDEALAEAFRTNDLAVSTSPYDVLNPDQYNLVNEFLDGPYALYSAPESGGPLGVLFNSRETRTAADVSATWLSSRNARLTVGGDYTWYGLTHYQHNLTSNAGADLYLASPDRLALYLEERFGYDQVRVDLGLRYDRFASGAVRPYVLDTLATTPGSGGAPNPAYGTYSFFPRWVSYSDADGMATINGQPMPLVEGREDPSHGAWSPRGSIRLVAGRGTVVRAAASRIAVLPELHAVFTGANTDMARTFSGATWGGDLGFSRGWSLELGARQTLGAHGWLDGVVFSRTLSNVPLPVFRQLPDPTRLGAPVGIRVWDNALGRSARGIEGAFGWHRGTVDLSLGLTLQRIRQSFTSEGPFASESVNPASWERPRVLSALLAYDSRGDDPGPREPGARVGLGLRWGSGLPYSRCAGGDIAGELARSGDPCGVNHPDDVFAFRLPAFLQLDLRASTDLSAGPGGVTLFAEARNLLNRRNTIAVYAATGETSNETARLLVTSGDLDHYANEAQANSVLQPDDAIDLRFAGAGASGCEGWTSSSGDAAAPSCVALVRAEQRWGNGDGLFARTEQQVAADARFNERFQTGFFDAPRRVRVGFEVNF
ncbi:MAG TPA: hypothetical protein VFS94_05915 [Gemmatimonadales bacterium]|nr:hypothetical protein [Gemmatimonadales bacterium]